MKQVEPKVFLIGETKLVDEPNNDVPDLRDYLEEIGAPDWETATADGKPVSDSEELVEFMGRLCYRSFKPGLNPNISKVREGNDKYLAHIIGVGHGSVTEHVGVNFVFHDVSRVFTHELVRHRVGVAISQESLRYVRLEALKMWLPSCIKGYDVPEQIFIETVEYLEAQQRRLAEYFDIDNTKSFDKKKKLTSAFRRIAPIGLATSIGWSGNIRTLRHLIEMRTDRAAEEEIRLVFSQVAEICRKRYPNFFADYEVTEVDGLPEWKTERRKV